MTGKVRTPQTCRIRASTIGPALFACARMARGAALLALASVGSPRPAWAQSVPAADTSSAAPHTDTLRSPAEDSILAATKAFRTTGVARVVRAGNSVVFPFGHAEPAVTCARLRACVIELQPGEVVLSRIAGDLERWDIEPAAAGPGGRTTLVVVKPKDCNITTNLALGTNRRIYELTLDSPPCKDSAGGTDTNPQDGYTRLVRFYYPDDMVAQWSRPAAPTIAPTIASLNFDYAIKRDKQFPWQPAQVFDDGSHVYIKLPPAARHDAAPALFLVGSDGSRTLLNYSIVGDTYVTDRLFDKAVLVAGIDGKERKIEIQHSDGGRQ